MCLTEQAGSDTRLCRINFQPGCTCRLKLGSIERTMGEFGGNFPNYTLKTGEPPCHDVLSLSRSASGSRRGQLGSVRASSPPWPCQFGFDTRGIEQP